MKNEKCVNECIEMLEKLVVLRSFMTQNARRKLKKSCNAHEIKHVLSRKDIAELVDDSKSRQVDNVIVLKCDIVKVKYVVINRKVLATLIANSKYLLKSDLPMN